MTASTVSLMITIKIIIIKAVTKIVIKIIKIMMIIIMLAYTADKTNNISNAMQHEQLNFKK